MYVILGATGNTGLAVANALLGKGKKVRVVGRDAKKLAAFASRGAEAFVGDVADAEALSRAFAGADAAYTMTPPSMTSNNYRADQDQVTNAVAKAIESAGVKYVVALSSIGAGEAEKTGPVVGLHYMEAKFAEIAELNVLYLRAGYFMENTLPQAGIIQEFGMMAGPVRGDLPLPMIATRDIGMAAADALLRLDFSGKQTRELLGQRDVTYNEAARIVGTGIGKPALGYIQLPAEQVIMALTQMGISKNVANLICEMSDALNERRMKALEARPAADTVLTSFETFVKDVFVPAFKGRAAGV